MSEPEEILKIFTTDANLPLKTTRKTPLDSKRDIDGELAKWGIKKTMWTWDLENSECEIVFELPADKFHDTPLGVKLTPPIIWRRTGRYSQPKIDWRMSIRLLYWYIHFQLAWVYATQSSPVVAFLPFVKAKGDATVKDLLLPQLSMLKSLPPPDPKPGSARILDVRVKDED